MAGAAFLLLHSAALAQEPSNSALELARAVRESSDPDRYLRQLLQAVVHQATDAPEAERRQLLAGLQRSVNSASQLILVETVRDVADLGFVGGGEALVVLHEDGTSSSWSIRSGEATREAADVARIAVTAGDGRHHYCLWPRHGAGTANVDAAEIVREIRWLRASAAGTHIVLGGTDAKQAPVLRVRDLEHEKWLPELRGAAGADREAPSFLAINNDGEWLLTASHSPAGWTATAWNTGSGRPAVHLGAQPMPILGGTFFTSADRAITSGADGMLRIWELAELATWSPADPAITHYSCSELLGHDRLVVEVTEEDDRCLATGDADGAVRLWDLETRQELRGLRGHGAGIARIALASQAHLVATLDDADILRLWGVEAPRASIRQLNGELRAMSFNTDATVLAVAVHRTDGEAEIQVLATDSLETKRRFTIATNPPINALAIADVDGPIAAIREGQPSLFDGNAETPLFEPRRLLSVEVEAARNQVFTGGWDGLVELWSAQPMSVPRPLVMSGGRPWVLAAQPGGDLLAIAGDDGTIRLWDRAREGFSEPLAGAHAREVRGLAFAPDGKRLASASWDLTVAIWNVKERRLLHRLEGHTRPVNAVSFHPRAEVIASGASDGLILLWNANTGKLLRKLSGHTRSVRDVAFHPDGAWLASASMDHTARIWSLETGTLRYTLSGHGDTVWCVTFSPDGSRLLSAGADGSLRTWDCETGTPLGTWTGHSGAVNDAAFTPEGDRVVSVGDDGTCRWWNVSTGAQEGYSGRLSPPQETTGLALHSGASSIVLSVRGGAGCRLLGIDRVTRAASFDARYREELTVLAYAQHGEAVLTRAGTAVALVHDARSGQVRRAFYGGETRPSLAALDPDGRIVATAGTVDEVLVWDAKSGDQTSRLRDPRHSSAAVRALALAPGGTLAVAGADDGWIRGWDLLAGMQVFATPVPLDQIHALEFASTGELLLVAGTSGSAATVCQYQRESLAPRHRDGTLAMAFQRLPGRHARAIAAALTGDYDGARSRLAESEDRLSAELLEILASNVVSVERLGGLLDRIVPPAASGD